MISQGQKQTVNRKSVPEFAFLGTLGFGIGGAIGGAIWFALDAPHLGFAVLGGIGGAVLGSALKEDRKRTYLLALASAIGFDVGFLAGFFIVLTLWEPIYRGLLIGAIGGLIGGGALGLRALRDWKRAAILALASALGFGIAVEGTWKVFRGLTPQVLSGTMGLATWGAIGGASLGAALGYLSKTRAGIGRPDI